MTDLVTMDVNDSARRYDGPVSELFKYYHDELSCLVDEKLYLQDIIDGQREELVKLQMAYSNLQKDYEFLNGQLRTTQQAMSCLQVLVPLKGGDN